MAQLTEAETLRILLDGAADGLLLADAEDRVLLANRVFREAAELLGLQLDRPFTEALLELADATGEPYAFTAAVGRLRHEAGAVEFEDAAGGRAFRLDASSPDQAPGRAWTLRELTRERDHDRSVDERIAAIGHDLRTPLTSMSGFVGLLRDGDQGPLSPKQQRYLDIVQRAADRLQQLVDELLATPRRDVSGSEEAP